jgi:catechol 2,3-dioxygenase-like lactoylglutathione lyase family enzyme
MGNQIFHTGVTVPSLERSLEFYTGVLGMVVVQRNHREGAMIEAVTGMPGAVLEIAHVAFPEHQEMRVELLEYVAPRGRQVDTRTNNPGTAHVAFFVDEIDRLYQHLLANGVTVRCPPFTIDQPPGVGNRCFYFLDCNGFTLEAVQLAAG